MKGVIWNCLNYAGCKDVVNNVDVSGVQRTALTMRDVKIEETYDIDFNETELP